MKIILGRLQAEFLRELLENRIDEAEQMRDDVLGGGGPSGPRAIKEHLQYHEHMIKGCKELLEKLRSGPQGPPGVPGKYK